jgi:hypothetical protein
VVIDWHDPIVVAALPDEMAISAITAAELDWSRFGSTMRPCAATVSSSPAWFARNAGLDDLVHVVAI